MVYDDGDARVAGLLGAHQADDTHLVASLEAGQFFELQCIVLDLEHAEHRRVVEQRHVDATSVGRVVMHDL